jgi:DNA-binding transcriptional LysR family regulator
MVFACEWVNRWGEFIDASLDGKAHRLQNAFAKIAKQNMNLSDLNTFIRVAELGSLSAVAREQDAPVSQVSRALARLEALHAVRLLHRSTHALSLTEAGQSLLSHGRHMLDAYAQFESELDAGEAVRGTVVVATSPSMARYVIAPCLRGLSALHPLITVELHVDDRIVDMTQLGIDVAIRTGEPGADSLVARPIGGHSRHLYAAPSYIAARGTPRSVDDLGAHSLITNSAQTPLNRWPFKVGGKSIVYQARGHYRANSTDLLISMAAQGLGIVRASDLVCESLVAQGQLVRVLEGAVDSPNIPILAVMPQDRHRTPKVRAFVDFFAAWLAKGAAKPPQNRPKTAQKAKF